jgi:hypothetical protein
MDQENLGWNKGKGSDDEARECEKAMMWLRVATVRQGGVKRNHKHEEMGEIGSL